MRIRCWIVLGFSEAWLWYVVPGWAEKEGSLKVRGRLSLRRGGARDTRLMVDAVDV